MLSPYVHHVSAEYTDPVILEYEPLFQLQQSLPRRHGLLMEDIVYTCLDVSPKYLVLGSTKGLVVVYEQGSWQQKTFHVSGPFSRKDSGEVHCRKIYRAPTCHGIGGFRLLVL